MTGFDKIEHASLTDVGVRRSLNEDNHAILLASDEEKWRLQGHLFLVADGMGGHAVGELASELAAANVPHTYHKHAVHGPVVALRRAFQEANATIYARGQQNPEFKEMGTTATALLLRPEGAWIGHVGDSRVYRIRDGQIEQLTFDHSHVWDIARRMHLNPEEVPGISSNLLMRSLGPQPMVQVDIEGPHPLRENDIFVLCSDGLSGQVTDQELGAVATVLPPAEACRFLVDLANLRGGPDNITVLIVRLGSQSATAASSQPPARQWRRLPSPLAVQLLGILLAVGAAILTTVSTWLAVLMFLLAAAAIVGGLIALLVQHSRQKQRPVEEEIDLSVEPNIYRQSSCRVEPLLLDKLARAVQALKQQAEEKQWDVDWVVYQRHHEAALCCQSAGQLEAAFAEYCRAMRPLTEALSRNRFTEGVLQHVWDKEEA
ncbi:MAG TPA: protein phosphatase 2C domain-containing protein [Gemmataceae bacterium]|nr:protein phosphatase 2C domain-containing protein [Gemmataceae bacterium]